MKYSSADFAQIVNNLMYNFSSYDEETLVIEGNKLSQKLLRWMVAHHPDNRCRKVFLRMTNVACGKGSVVNMGFLVSDDYEPLLTIGERVAISPHVMVICSSSPNNSNLLGVRGFRERYVKSLPVVIDDDSWIGAGAIVLPGVRIGKRCIVGAGSVVSQDVLDDSIVVGCPARTIGSTCQG